MTVLCWELRLDFIAVFTSYSSTLIFLFSVLILTSLRASCSATGMPRSPLSLPRDGQSVRPPIVAHEKTGTATATVKVEFEFGDSGLQCHLKCEISKCKKKKKKRGNELKCVCRAHELVIVPVKARRIILLPFLFPFYSCCILNV